MVRMELLVLQDIMRLFCAYETMTGQWLLSMPILTHFNHCHDCGVIKSTLHYYGKVSPIQKKKKSYKRLKF